MRTACMLWGNVKISGSGGSLPDTITPQTDNTVSNGKHTHKIEIESIPVSSITGRKYVVKYGCLYNGYIYTDSRHLTSSDDWVVSGSLYNPTSDISLLNTFVGGNAGKLKETGTLNWLTPNTGATNEYGFNARPSGMKWGNTFSGLGENFVLGEGDGYWGGQTYFAYDSTLFGHGSGFDDRIGVAIRLRRLTTALTHGQVGTYVGNDGKIYPTICIDGIEWLACNLAETQWRDHTAISYVPGDWTDRTTEAYCFYDDLSENAGSYLPLDHNSLDGIQGGSETERYHLTLSELTKLQAIVKPIQITGLTLVAANWALFSGLYEYDLADANITAAMVVDVIPENADITIVKAAEILPKTVSSAGSVKLYATNAPTGNVGVTIILTTATT